MDTIQNKNLHTILSVATAVAVLIGLLAIPASLTGCSKKNKATITVNTSSNTTGTATTQNKNSNQVMSQNQTGSAIHKTIENGTAELTSETAVTPAKPVEPEKLCYTETFKHKAVAGHGDDEACSRHRNLIRLKHEGVNAKNICVRVDGTPVRFQPVTDKNGKISLMVGPVAGPRAKVTVRYCLGKSTCKEDCTIPKDEFMEAIGGGDDDSNKAPGRQLAAAQWDPSDNEKVQDVSAEIDGDVMKELADETDLAIFEDWLSENETSACRSKS